MKRKHKKQNGFTLIELLVVISIISLLASILLVSTVNTRKKARDAVRKQTLRQLQKALELYYSENGTYPQPATTGEYSSESGTSTTCPGCMTDAPGVYIPGLAPTYVGSLPHDPNPQMDVVCAGWKAAYVYQSNGKDYKLKSHCAAEMGYSATDEFFDPIRPTWSWQVSTPGAAGW